MTWRKLRLKIASGLLIACIMVNSYGAVSLILFKYDRWLLLGYMGLAVLTIPAFVLVHFLASTATRQKAADQRSARERLFIKLYDMNLRLAAAVGIAVFITLALKNR